MAPPGSKTEISEVGAAVGGGTSPTYPQHSRLHLKGRHCLRVGVESSTLDAFSRRLHSHLVDELSWFGQSAATMSQEKSDEEKDNVEKTELIPANVSELRMALASIKEEQKQHSDGLAFVVSHASLFHTIHAAVKSCQEIRKCDDNIKEANQIGHDKKRRVENEETNSAVESKDLQAAGKDLEPASATEYQEPSLAAEDREPLSVMEMQEPESTQEPRSSLERGSLLEALEPGFPMETEATVLSVEVQEPDSAIGVQGFDLLVKAQGPSSPVEAEPVSSDLRGQEPDSAMEAQATSLPVGEQEPDSTMEAQTTSLSVGVQEPDSAMEAQATSLPVGVQEPDSAMEAQATSLAVGVQEPDSAMEAQATSLPVGEQEPDSAMEAQATSLPVGVQEPDSAMEAQATSLAVGVQEPDSTMGAWEPDSVMEVEVTHISAGAQEPDSAVGVQESDSAEGAQISNAGIKVQPSRMHEAAPVPSSSKDTCKPVHSKLFHKTKSLLSVAKSKSVIFKTPQKDEPGELAPSDLFLYLALIESCLPLPVSTIQKLCLKGDILCRIQYFTLRQQKKEQLPQPQRIKTILRIPKLERIRGTDYVTFDSLRDLQWKLYKGLVKRKPKTKGVWKAPTYSAGIVAVQPSKAVEYILPLIPKDWIIDDSLKFSRQMVPFLMEH